MRSITKFLAIGAMLAASSSMAFATPISGSAAISEMTGGTVTFDNTHIAFAPDTGNITGANGTMASFQGLTATLSDLTFSSASGVKLFTVTSGANTLSYTLSSASVVTYNPPSSPGGSYLDVTGSGTFSETGYADTTGTFILTASNSGITNFEITGTATATVTPEPNSLLLMGTGLVAAGTLLFMRRRHGAIV